MKLQTCAAVLAVLYSGSQLAATEAQAAPLSSKSVFVLCANSSAKTLVARVKKCRKDETKVDLTNLASFGAVGPTGPSGAAGATGPTGPSAFDAIPSGTTIRGVVGLDVEAPATSGDFRVAMTFPAKLTQKLQDADFLFASTSVVDNDCTGAARCTAAPFSALCTGTASNPTAPAGKVCLYVESASNATNIAAWELGDDPAATVTSGLLLAFGVDGSVGDAYVQAVWAYTAP